MVMFAPNPPPPHGPHEEFPKLSEKIQSFIDVWFGEMWFVERWFVERW